MIKKCKINIFNNNFAFCIDENDEKIYIHSSKLNGANDEDVVAVEVFKEKEENKSAEAKVIKIIEKAHKKHIGIIYKKNSKMSFIRAKTISNDIVLLNKNNKVKYRNNDVVIFEIDGNNYAKLVKNVGKFNDLKTREYIKLFESNILIDFPKEVIKESIKIDDLNDSKRVNLNDKFFVTIDGDDAKDLDDAVYIEEDENFYTLYVSIADVSNYVLENTKLDLEARKRGNSTYLLTKVIPMLPEKLSNDLCSLNPDTVKKTFTVEMKYDKKGNQKDFKIYKSSIISKQRLTYTYVNKVFSKNIVNSKVDEILLKMKNLSQLLRDKMIKKGYISFEFDEIKFDIKTLKPYFRKRGLAEEMIENFMIAANETVGNYIYWQVFPTMYRVHEKIEMDKVKEINLDLKNIDDKLSLPITREVKSYDIQNILKSVKNTEKEYIVNKLILRSMPRARYDTKPLGHFALSIDYYLHFTSPIRRYSDLIVHRFLNDIINNKIYSENKIKKLEKKLDEIKEIINITENTSEKLENECIKVASIMYMENKLDEIYTGIVSGETKNKVFFELDNGIEVVHLKHDNTKYILGERYNLKIKKINYRAEEIEVFENGICK